MIIDPTSRARGRRWGSLLRFAAVATGSLLVFAFGLFAWNARFLSSSIFGDPFFAAAFSIIPLLLGFPVLMVFGFLSRFIVEKFRKKPLPVRKYLPWLLPALIGLIGVVCSFLQDRSATKLFGDYLSIKPPASVSNFQYWWTTLPGDSLFAFSFKLNPADFNKLLTNHAYVADSDPQNIAQELKDNLPRGLVGSSIQTPAAPIVVVYKYSKQDPTGLPHIVDVFVTQGRDQIVICGDN